MPSEMQPLQRGNIRLAATVMLIRDGAEGLQVYMVQRPGKGDFPDLHVFPGGKVDESDFAPPLCHGIDDQQASQRLGLAAGGLRYWMAVARECFEECGVLLVKRGASALDLSDGSLRRQLLQDRQALLNGQLDFNQLCAQQQLSIDCERLAYFSHWITPEMAPRRFDTRFFLAAMPPDQLALADTEETAGEHWAYPQEALARHAQGDWQMIDPTIRSLQTLSQYPNVEQALLKVNEGNHLMPLTPELQRQGMQALR